MIEKFKFVLLCLIMCIVFTGCSKSKVSQAEEDLASAKSAQATYEEQRQANLDAGGLSWLKQTFKDASGDIGLGKNQRYYQAKTAEAESNLKSAKVNSYIKIVIIAILVIIGIVVLLAILKRKRRLTPVAVAGAATVAAAPASSAKLNVTEAEVQALCAQKGRDYSEVMQQCGSLDNAYYYLTTGRNSSFTPW